MTWILPALLLASSGAVAAELKPQTSAAFDEVIRQTEQRLEQRKPFLWAEESPSRLQRVLDGALVVEPSGAKAIRPVPDGLVHDWTGAVFLPGVSLEKTLALVRDYDHHELYYKPEVVDARVLRHDGNDYLIFMRLLKKQIITVVLDTEHEVHYTQVDPKRWRSRSRTTKISEVEHPGKSDERVLPPGTGEGFLWRLNSYWRFEERNGGTVVECQAVSLSRDIPTGLGWLIEPVIRKLPRESLENTLRETRAALVK
jgi:hypothetical protein